MEAHIFLDPPKAEVTGSTPVGCTNIFHTKQLLNLDGRSAMQSLIYIAHRMHTITSTMTSTNGAKPATQTGHYSDVHYTDTR